MDYGHAVYDFRLQQQIVAVAAENRRTLRPAARDDAIGGKSEVRQHDRHVGAAIGGVRAREQLVQRSSRREEAPAEDFFPAAAGPVLRHQKRQQAHAHARNRQAQLAHERCRPDSQVDEVRAHEWRGQQACAAREKAVYVMKLPVADRLRTIGRKPHFADDRLTAAIQRGRTTQAVADRKSTRLNSSHMSISYAVFCLKKKKKRKLAVLASKKQKSKRWERRWSR